MAGAPLSTLQIITDGVKAIEAGCEKRNVNYPSLDDPLTPESIAIQESFFQDALPVIAAAHQLVATLMSPYGYYSSQGLALSICPLPATGKNNS